MTAPSVQPEHELLHRARRGDDDAFDRLVELYAPRVYDIAYRLSGNADDAHDCAQEAFLRVYDALPKFRGDAAFSTWLYRIVVNVCNDELARRKRRPTALTDMEHDEGSAFAETLASGDSVEEELVRRERQRCLQEAIAELPEHFRAVLVLYDLQGFHYEEIAEMPRTNLGTVKSRLSRARNLLREKLSTHRELFGFEGSPTHR